MHAYQALAVEYVHQNRDVKHLNCIGHNEESFQETNLSWVPRWDITVTTSVEIAFMHSPLRSRNLLVPEPSMIGTSTVRVHSVILDELV